MKNKRLSVAYIILFCTIVALTILSQVVISNSIADLEQDGRLINLAGRQRMLSQAVLKNTLLNTTESEFKKSQQLQELRTVHNALGKGNDGLEVSALPSHFRSSYSQLDEDFKIFVSALTQYDANPNSENLNAVSFYQTSFLERMNDIVYEYEIYNKEKLSKFKRLELFLAIFAMIILFAEFFFIFLPIINTLREQNKLLEIAMFQQSHKMRHPITNIQLTLNLLKTKPLAEEDQELVKKALAESKLLDEQIRLSSERIASSTMAN